MQSRLIRSRRGRAASVAIRALLVRVRRRRDASMRLRRTARILTRLRLGTRVSLMGALGVCALAAPAAAAFDRDSPRDRSIVRSYVLANSVRGRPIPVLERGDPDARLRELIVGCIYGNEPAGIA